MRICFAEDIRRSHSRTLICPTIADDAQWLIQHQTSPPPPADGTASNASSALARGEFSADVSGY
jgi:hypothetical protein